MAGRKAKRVARKKREGQKPLFLGCAAVVLRTTDVPVVTDGRAWALRFQTGEPIVVDHKGCVFAFTNVADVRM